MAQSEVTALPNVVVISKAADIRMTPNQIRALKAETGRSLTELLSEDADDGDRFQAIAWLQLRRQGVNAHWDDVGDIEIQLGEDEEPDPMNGPR